MPMSNEPNQDHRPAAPEAPAPTLALVREVQGPAGDRGRVAGLAMVCSAAGVALGFALAGSLFAAMSPPRMTTTMGPAGYGGCPGRHHGRAPMVDGHVETRPWLGIDLSGHDQPVLTRVFADSPAEQIGLRPGDRVTSIDGHPVATSQELLVHIRRHAPGDVISLEVDQRDGRHLVVEGVPLSVLPLPLR